MKYDILVVWTMLLISFKVVNVSNKVLRNRSTLLTTSSSHRFTGINRTESTKDTSDSRQPYPTPHPYINPSLGDDTNSDGELNTTSSMQFHGGISLEEHEKLRERASLLVGVIFIPGLILLYLFCRFVIPCISDVKTDKWKNRNRERNRENHAHTAYIYAFYEEHGSRRSINTCEWREY